MATEIWVNIGSGNGLLPDDTKPLPEPMMTYQWSFVHPTTILQAAPEISDHGMSLKIIILKLQSHLPGASELMVVDVLHITACFPVTIIDVASFVSFVTLCLPLVNKSLCSCGLKLDFG